MLDPDRVPFPVPERTMCIEYNLARIILSQDFDLYRKDDSYLWLLEHTGLDGYHRPGEDEKPLRTLPVEQGFFTATWDGSTTRISYRCEELIYFDDFLRALASVHAPNFKTTPCNAMGRGRQTWHAIGEYYRELAVKGIIEPPKENISCQQK